MKGGRESRGKKGCDDKETLTHAVLHRHERLSSSLCQKVTIQSKSASRASIRLRSANANAGDVLGIFRGVLLALLRAIQLMDRC